MTNHKLQFPGDDGERESKLSPNYDDILRRVKCGEPSFDVFVEALYATMQRYDAIDPSKKDPLKPIRDRADGFLRGHAGISYESFLRQAKPEEFTENDFGTLPKKKNLRRRLFDHRAMLYLAALDDTVKQGYDLDSILAEVRKREIPYIKKEANEPTFKEILKVLGKLD